VDAAISKCDCPAEPGQEQLENQAGKQTEKQTMEPARSLPYDPALMDMTMPQPNGLATDVPPLDAQCRRAAGMTTPATKPAPETRPRAPTAGTATPLQVQ
jgi:hypothetical protein